MIENMSEIFDWFLYSGACPNPVKINNLTNPYIFEKWEPY